MLEELTIKLVLVSAKDNMYFKNLFILYLSFIILTIKNNTRINYIDIFHKESL